MAGCGSRSRFAAINARHTGSISLVVGGWPRRSSATAVAIVQKLSPGATVHSVGAAPDGVPVFAGGGGAGGAGGAVVVVVGAVVVVVGAAVVVVVGAVVVVVVGAAVVVVAGAAVVVVDSLVDVAPAAAGVVVVVLGAVVVVAPPATGSPLLHATATVASVATPSITQTHRLTVRGPYTAHDLVGRGSSLDFRRPAQASLMLEPEPRRKVQSRWARRIAVDRPREG